VTSIAVLLSGFISSVLVIATSQSASGKVANSISFLKLLISRYKGEVVGRSLRRCHTDDFVALDLV
jgi:hypothetical protein